MKTLDLVVKHKWYDMIESGEKTEEYREMKPYWWNMLYKIKQEPMVCHISYSDNKEIPVEKEVKLVNKRHYITDNDIIKCEYTHVRFRRGYTNTTMTLEIKGITIGVGKSEWGAPNECVFIIKLGNKIMEE